MQLLRPKCFAGWLTPECVGVSQPENQSLQMNARFCWHQLLICAGVWFELLWPPDLDPLRPQLQLLALLVAVIWTVAWNICHSSLMTYLLGICLSVPYEINTFRVSWGFMKSPWRVSWTPAETVLWKFHEGLGPWRFQLCSVFRCMESLVQLVAWTFHGSCMTNCLGISSWFHPFI